jgi:hypothetical protein
VNDLAPRLRGLSRQALPLSATIAGQTLFRRFSTIVPATYESVVMNNSLQQINMAYIPEQDRLLLRISTSSDAEYRIWLTRRYSALLLQVFLEQIEREGGYQDLASRQDTRERLRGGALDQPYNPAPKMHYPLGEQGVLAYRINVGKDPTGVLNLQLLPEQGQGVTFTLDKSTLYMLYNVLEQALSQTEWNLHVPRGRDPVH